MATLPDYSINVAQPFTEALKGYQLGMGFEAAKQQNILQQQQAQQALQQQKTLQDAQRLVIQNPNAENYSRLMTLDPKSSEGYQRAWTARNTQQQETLAADLLKQGAAITSGKPEIAAQYLEDQASAIEAKNNGQPTPESQAARTQARIMKEHPQFALGQIQALLSLNPLGKQAAETLAKFGDERRAEAQAPAKQRQELAAADKAEAEAKVKMETATDDIAKAKATREFEQAKAFKEQVEAKYAEGVALDAIKKRAADLRLTTNQASQALAMTNKLGIETKKAAIELAALENGTGDPKEKFTQEEKIRKEWQGRSKMYGELQNTFNTLQASAQSANGPGDIALITGFMKMLDPGSVVRETEFATARDTAGLFTQLQNRLEKAQNGQLLSPKQRSEYVALSQKYLDSAQKKANQEKKDLGIVVKNYRLNPENVFGAEQAPPPPLPTSATVGGVTYPRPTGFTDAQWRDYLKANGVIQ